MLTTLNELFDKWWFILAYSAMWWAIFNIPVWIIQKKLKHK